MKAILSFAVAAMLILSAAGCNTTTDPNSDGVQMTVTQLFDTPGYSWMRSEVASYSPNPAVVSEIAAEFQAKKQKVYLYVNPSCTCTGTKKRFPQTIRTLQEAGLTENDIVIVSMRSSKDKQPFSDRFTVRGLPSFFITRAETPVFAIQTVNEVLIANPLASPDKPAESAIMEDVLLEGFKQ